MTVSNRLCTFCGKKMPKDWIAETCPECFHEERPDGYWEKEPFQELFNKIKDIADRIEKASKNKDCLNVIPFPNSKEKIKAILKSGNYKIKEHHLENGLSYIEIIGESEDEK